MIGSFFLLGSCVTTIRSYSADTLHKSRDAILRVDAEGVFAVQPILRSLDGQTMYKFLGPVVMNVEIAPGHHAASIGYFKENIGPRDCSAEDQSVDFLAEPGHTYKVLVNVFAALACGLGGSRLWKASIVDITDQGHQSQK